MPSIDDNKKKWGTGEEWSTGGDNWSAAWGSPQTMWYGSLLPRIVQRLPVRRLLEIAPGYGRVTAFLLDHCEEYDGVDLAENCVEACRERFADRDAARFHVGDGKSLAGIPDGEVDFAFSWDSMVHADEVAVGGYVQELSRVLRPGAYGFIHHSNMAAHPESAGNATPEPTHWRDRTVSAAKVQGFCAQAGLQCRAQELLQWGTEFHSDCITLLRRPAAPGDGVDAAPQVWTNMLMAEEMGYSRIRAQHYEG